MVNRDIFTTMTSLGDGFLYADAGFHDLQRLALFGGRPRRWSWVFLLWMAQTKYPRHQ